MAGDLAGIVGILADAGVEFIVIGGLAAQAHGSARLTQDADFVYRRSPENIARLCAALAPHRPYLRGAPAGLPFQLDEDTVRRGLNFTLTTSVADVDLLGEEGGSGNSRRAIISSRSFPQMTLAPVECCISEDKAGGIHPGAQPLSPAPVPQYPAGIRSTLRTRLHDTGTHPALNCRQGEPHCP